MSADIIKVIAPAVLSFVVGVCITPIVTYHLYKYRIWQKRGGKIAFDGKEAIEFNKIHAAADVKTPRMGGIVIWASVFITIFGIALLARWWPTAATLKLDFLSRDQTWIPLTTLLVGAVTGLINDLLDIREVGVGMALRYRLIIISALSTFIGWWFYFKLDVIAIGIPFSDPFEIGWLIIPFFVAVALAIYASGIIDGIDGLSGGVFASIFAAYTLIAYTQNQINLAALSAAIVGGILSFLWFNIPPARFYMTETGTMALTLTVAVLAFMTDTLGGGIGISVLPIIGFLLVATVASVLLQLASKRFLGRKIFRVAPLHHHFEAIGWPGYKVTMRYWVLSLIFATTGVIIALVGT